MKLFLQLMILTIIFTVSACTIQSPHHTSSARAAYGNAVQDFKAHNKKNQKRKRNAVRKIKRQKVKNKPSLWHGRPY